jgi:hypothetical protein
VHERGKVCDLIGSHGERRHTAVGPATADHRSYQLALLIVEDELRAQQARSAVAAPDVGAMAERAVGTEGGAPALDGRLIFLALGIRADADAADAAASGWSRRLALLRSEKDWR